ncbi:MAG: cation:proton antiporter [Sandaracinaceae bacterium]|nr:cation:proton antiporter [Sandaracinaceae bacterium]
MSTTHSAHPSAVEREGRSLRQFFIVVALVMLLVFLHRWAGTTSFGDLDPTAMLALGFVVLGSYTIGALAEIVRLPHITGYLLAGLFFGPSVAHALAPALAALLGAESPWPPFDRGILNQSVVQQLSLFDTLAIALIAISAGGELKLAALRQDIRAILGIIAGQYALVMLSVTGFVVLISGFIPSIALPGLGVTATEALGLGVVVAAIAFAASPAATLAIISETGASGPMSRTVLNTIVFEDILVIVTFVVGKFLAATLLGAEVEPMGVYVAQHVGGGLGLGLVLGLAVGLYLRFVSKQLMIFLVGVVYTATLVADQVHADKLLMFLTLGFIVGNFSRAGERLIEQVERLALPTYVVFFTIAGARMHVDQLRVAFPFALALCTLRFASIYVGVRAGARLGGAPPVTVKYGWLGFVAQAGVALALANQLMGIHGSRGAALGTMVMGGIALNELFGPVLFKLAVVLAGEGRASAGQEEEGLPRLSVPPPAIAIRPVSSAPNPSSDTTPAVEDPAMASWPEPQVVRSWGKPLNSGVAALDQRVVALERDLQAIVREVGEGPLAAWREEAEAYLHSLRREFLRHHRRLLVRAREPVGLAPTDDTLFLRAELAELAERWRGIVLSRGLKVGQGDWTPMEVVVALDGVVASLPETVRVPFDPSSFEAREHDSLLQIWGAAVLRARRWARRLVDNGEPTRILSLRELGRYHLSGTAPDKLQALAVLFVQGDRHLANRTRSVFDVIVRGYEGFAETGDDRRAEPSALPREALQARSRALRASVDAELALALDEVRRIALDGTARTASSLAAGVDALRRDCPVYGTHRLPSHKRRTSRVFTRRTRALEAMDADIVAHRRASSCSYGLLAMNLELVVLVTRVGQLVDEYGSRLAGELERRVCQQVERSQEALERALTRLRRELATARSADALRGALRELMDDLGRVVGETNRVALQFHEEQREDAKLAMLLDAMLTSAATLTPRYEVLEGRVDAGEWTNPAALEPLDVEFRDIVQACIEDQVGPELRSASHELLRRVQPLLTILQDLERKIAFATELATSELEVLGEEPLTPEVLELVAEMVAAPLERNKAAIDDFAERACAWPRLERARVRDATQRELMQLQTLLAGGGVSRARLRDLGREAEARRLRYRAGQLPSALFGLPTELALRVGRVAAEPRFDRVRGRLGLLPVARSGSPDSHLFAAPVPHPDLPLGYKRLFLAEALDAGEVALGREREIHRAQRVLSQRVEGRLRSIALVGVDGVGKVAVANAIVRTGRFKHVRRVTLTEPCDAGAFEEVVGSGPEGQLVIVEGVHWLLSMRPGGFEPLRRFADLVVADRGRHAWLLQVDALFFRYACGVAPLAKAFPEVVQLAPLSREALRDAVLDRARHSGLRTVFERDQGDGGAAVRNGRPAFRLRDVTDEYFRDLHAASGGLVRDAFRLWLASVRGVLNDDAVRVGRVPTSAHAALARLSDDVLLTLLQVMRQGWTQPPVQAHLFRVDLGVARGQLSRLAHLGLLEEVHRDTYCVPQHLRGALMRVLTDRGWV